MFTGGDSSGEGFNQLNNFVGLANMTAPTMPPAGTAIDWASLAQQWIQMQDNQASEKEMCSYSAAAGLPEAPPPPTISINNDRTSSALNSASVLQATTKKFPFEDHAMEDMDLDDGDEENESRMLTSSPPPPAPSMTIVGEATMPLQQQLWYNMQQTTGLDMGHGNMQPLAPSWNAWQSTNSPSGNSGPINPTAHIPSLLKLNVPHPNVIKAMPDTPTSQDSSSFGGIDAAKRKTLPAWLREGLEKLEREKQKQLEKEQTAPPVTSTQMEMEPALGTPNAARVKNLLSNDLESDNSGKEDNEDAAVESGNIDGERISERQKAAAGKHKNKADSEDDIDGDSIGGNNHDDHPVGKSYEQKLADLMINVRRTLTELLLEVTNEQIADIAQHALKTYKTKASSAQVIRKSALSSITGKLGLADYANSSSEDESDNESASNRNGDSDDSDGNNSEEELRTTIRQKRRSFAKVSEDIDDKVAANAMREEEKLKYYTQLEKEKEQSKRQREESADSAEEEENNSDSDSEGRRRRHASTSKASSAAMGKNYDRHFGETSSDTKSNQYSNGKQRQRERLARKERTTRFSDNKDPQGNATFATPTTASAVSAAATFLAQQQQQLQQQQQQQTVGMKASRTIKASSAGSSGIVHPVNLPSRLPDANGLYTAVSYGSSADSCPPPQHLSRVLSAAEAALDKANRKKSYADERRRSSSRQHRSRHSKRRHRRRSSDEESSDSSDSSDDSSTSTTNSSRSSSKYSRTSSSRRHKRSSHSRSQSRSHRRSSHKRDYYDRDYRRDRGDDRYGRDSGSSRRHRHHSSDSNDESSHRHHRSKHSSSSSSRHNHNRKSKSRSRSKSRSSYSSVSKHRH